jgi:hypothetical protein
MAIITEDYCSFEVAKLLKEKGFKEDVTELNKLLFKEGEKPVLQITHQKAMKWLREMHNIHIGINPISGKGYNATIYDVADFDDYGIISDTESFFHVEQACEVAIKYCLEKLI